jgi:putative sulfotransferase
MDGRSPLFVVGTGRCGSTMLSDLLREHDRVLSLSEFFCFTTDLGGRIARAFATEPLDAGELWRLIAGAHPKQTTMVRHGVGIPEMLYQPGPSTRFTAETGVPALMQTTLPHLTPDAETLFSEVEAFVAGLPPAPMADHYARLFDWLTARFEKRIWVERSGGSLRVVRRLMQTFPGARFVHIVRDGRACARSMSRHYGFRMALIAMQLTEILGVDPYESSDRTYIGDVPDDLVPFLPEAFDAEAFRRWETPLPLCGHYWSGEIRAGVRELLSLPADRVLTMRYEDFLTDPERSLSQLAAFLGPEYVDDAWVTAAAPKIRCSASTPSSVGAAELRALDEACRPGFAALADLYPEPAA